MILVADSGSSSSEWMLHLPDSDPLSFRTKGLNPYFVSEKEIARVLGEVPEIIPYISEVHEVYFFGAGCSTPDRREIVSNALSAIFPDAFIAVETELMGTAYATLGTQPGIVCNIGTGSDMSFFDGEYLSASLHGNGYVLGDEGSGAWFGKQLIMDFLYGTMPRDVAKLFEEQYHVTKEVVVKNVYQKDRPNAYLASFVPFMDQNRLNPYIDTLLRNGFDEFVRTHIMTYPSYAEHECNFVGRVAFHFDMQLRDVCELHGVNVGRILKSPIKPLFDFVIQREMDNALTVGNFGAEFE
ncbi:N-acetylglucosamine kinase [Sphingobacterium populi]|uniref:N-acetylglucosamine kinase n=1 Tax=Sphingobacterium populi TaxID=1812824 RepID=A0ABW5UDL0_9SPHI